MKRRDELGRETLPPRLQKLMQSTSLGVVPSARSAHLVRAASPGANALDHWNAYAAASNTTFPDAGEIRLFPLVRYNLGEDENAAANQSWFSLETDYDAVQDAALFAAQAKVSEILTAANLPFVWTKGTALAASIYPDRGLRPSSDLDMLMPWDCLPALVACAKAHGWEGKLGVAHLAKGTPFMRYRGSEVSWVMQDGVELDVNWMPRLPFAYDRFAMDWIMATVAKTGSHIANPTWLLIEAIEHGLNANIVSPVRWVVDALWLIDRHGQDIDWEMVVTLTKRYHLACLMRVGLTVLQDFTDAIPETVMAQIIAIPISAVEMDEFAMRSTTIDHATRDLASVRYNAVLRAPQAIYAKNKLSPRKGGAGVSLRLRGQIAARNLHARLIWPVTKRFSPTDLA